MRMIMRVLVAVLVLGGAMTSGTAGDAPTKNLFDTAVGVGSFKVLVEAVKSADLVGTLQGKGPYTVFAPTDEAFKKIPAVSLQALLKDRKRLAEVLKYHVAPGKIQAVDLASRKGIKTVQGDEITIEAAEGKVLLNGKATVVKSDVECTNGVIQVIDRLLLPPDK